MLEIRLKMIEDAKASVLIKREQEKRKCKRDRIDRKDEARAERMEVRMINLDQSLWVEKDE